MGEFNQACKATCFWLSLLWIPILGFSVISYSGGMIPITGLLLPFAGMLLFAVFTCVALGASGMLQEDKDKGDAGVVASVMRSSTTSLSGRRGSKDDLEAAMGTGSQGSNPSANRMDAQMIGAGGYNPADRDGAHSGGYNGYGASSSAFAAGAGRGGSVGDAAMAGLGTWQVEMDHGWVNFEQAQQSAFSTGLLHDLPKVEFTVAHQRYELVFASQVQRNIRTGKERNVRCAMPGDSAAPSGRPAAANPQAAAPARTPGPSAFDSPADEWQVQMDSGKWHDMDAVTNTIINDASSRGDASVFFRTHGQDIELNFAARTQKNTKTNKERPVRMKPKGTSSSPGGHPMPAGDSSVPQDDSDGVGRDLQQM